MLIYSHKLKNKLHKLLSSYINVIINFDVIGHDYV